jgi:pSer/pThr/pTyr-binding forkhead associated (FHA) protein
MPVLVGVSIDYKGKTFDLTEEEVSVGRGDQNVITLNNSSISGRHCVLSRNGMTYNLQDLGSTNGTRVNGQPVTEVILQDRDVIHFGALEFVFADQQVDDIDIDTLQTVEMQAPQIEVSTDPAKRPDTFSSVSPFGTPRRKAKRSWYILIGIIGILALVCVALLFYILFVG